MPTGIQVVMDCADPAHLAEFWAAALGYVLQEPPAGFSSWPDFLRAQGIPESEWNRANAVVDPEKHLPRIYFQRVPEPKTVKNRVHMDLNVSGGLTTPLEDRRKQVDAEVERLRGLGAARLHVLEEYGEYCVVMHDPEGNEFCVQ